MRQSMSTNSYSWSFHAQYTSLFTSRLDLQPEALLCSATVAVTMTTSHGSDPKTMKHRVSHIAGGSRGRQNAEYMGLKHRQNLFVDILTNRNIIGNTRI